MNEILQRFSRIGVIPVVSLEDPSLAVPLCNALVAGGIGCVEFTFRTEAAEEAISNARRGANEIIIGAGTVLTTGQAERALNAGADFIVSPGFNPRVVDYALEQGAVIIPGVATPTERERAIERGVHTVKFFPAEVLGGVKYLRAVAAPYPMLRFVPTGGIDASNLKEYLEFERVAAVGGSWLAPSALINAGRFDEITEICRKTSEFIGRMRA
jgi:2-dehydro-3-deoxyphosphogluconate aldolase/(4S)-4-hydroxy-2-oxoglutarate aldolase